MCFKIRHHDIGQNIIEVMKQAVIRQYIIIQDSMRTQISLAKKKWQIEGKSTSAKENNVSKVSI
jgi:L-rhamnose mutarotase